MAGHSVSISWLFLWDMPENMETIRVKMFTYFWKDANLLQAAQSEDVHVAVKGNALKDTSVLTAYKTEGREDIDLNEIALENIR